MRISARRWRGLGSSASRAPPPTRSRARTATPSDPSSSVPARTIGSRRGEVRGVLHVHRAERADRLAEALADVLVEPLDDPFVAEVVAVSSRGVERWLAQRLSHRLGAAAGSDGVCANVAFPSPARLVAEVLDGSDPETTARWEPERL